MSFLSTVIMQPSCYFQLLRTSAPRNTSICTISNPRQIHCHSTFSLIPTSVRHFSSSTPRPAKKRKPKPLPSPSRTTNPFRESPVNPPSKRSPLFFFYALAGTGFAASITYVAVLFLRDPPDSESTPTAHTIPQDVSDRYHTTAATFDSDVAFFESISGLNRLRKKLVRSARGHVLEVSAGTGRNLSYYDFGPPTATPTSGHNGVKTLTLLDQADEMIGVARTKSHDLLPQLTGSQRIRFLTQSAMDPVETPKGGFDVVVQTMGLCSTGDPVGLIRRLAGIVEREEGRILLLEHGRGWYEWLNRALDRWAPKHADRHGCWWNRDIGEIVREAVEGSDGGVGRRLEVVRIKRHHLGTTWWVELRVKKDEQGGGSRN